MKSADVVRRQNSTEGLRTQAAVRQKASQAKGVRRLTWMVTWALVVAGPIAHFIDSDRADYVGAGAAAWLLASRLLFDPLERRWRYESASLAERHDRFVLRISERLAPFPGRVTGEELSAAADRYVQRRYRIARLARRSSVDPYRLLRDWFAVPPTLDDEALAVACQRGAAEYSRRLAVEWAAICRASAVILVGSFIVIALVDDMTLADYLVYLALPSVPAVLGLIDSAAIHAAGAAGRSRIVELAEHALSSVGTTPVPASLPRELADRAYEVRSSGPGAPDLYYRLRRSALEKDSQAVAYSSPTSP